MSSRLLPKLPSLSWLSHLRLGQTALALSSTVLAGGTFPASAADPLPNRFTIPVLVGSYFPTNGANVDPQVTGDWGASLAATREKTRRQTREVIQALGDGSRYLGFRQPEARPTLRYVVAGSLESLCPLPAFAKPGHRTPMTDCNQIEQLVGV